MCVCVCLYVHHVPVKSLQREDGLLAQALEAWALQQTVTGLKQSGQYDEAEALCSQVLKLSLSFFFSLTAYSVSTQLSVITTHARLL